MGKVLKWLGYAILAVLVVAGLGAAYIKFSADARLAEPAHLERAAGEAVDAEDAAPVAGQLERRLVHPPMLPRRDRRPAHDAPRI